MKKRGPKKRAEEEPRVQNCPTCTQKGSWAVEEAVFHPCSLARGFPMRAQTLRHNSHTSQTTAAKTQGLLAQEWVDFPP